LVFSSLLFLYVFLPLTVGLYYLAPRRFRNPLLFLASLVFYAWGEPVYILIMVVSTLLDFCCGLLVGRSRALGRDRAARLFVAVSVVGNLGLLVTFKYADFLAHSLGDLIGLPIPAPGLALPIGISFYTFQTMSYTLDVYRGDARVQGNFLSFGAYVALFPQLIAGPIVRYHEIAEDLDHRRESMELAAAGVRRLVIGLSKKVLVANSIGYAWDQVKALDPGGLPVLLAWFGILAFAFQIYFDFSGYSDMAIGLGNLFGFRFPENFRYPYSATSITDFWRRWHITLGTWFREYVYIPLGGSRAGPVRHLRNLLVVWMLTGLWHGASWNFLFWGLYYALFLVIEKFLFREAISRWPPFLGRAYAFLVVLVGWVPFEFTAVRGIAGYLASMAGFGGGGFGRAGLWDDRTRYLLGSFGVLLALAALGASGTPARWLRRLAASRLPSDGAPSLHPVPVAGLKTGGMAPGFLPVLAEAVGLVLLFLLATAFLVDASYNPFLYFRF